MRVMKLIRTERFYGSEEIHLSDLIDWAEDAGIDPMDIIVVPQVEEDQGNERLLVSLLAYQNEKELNKETMERLFQLCGWIQSNTTYLIDGPGLRDSEAEIWKRRIRGHTKEIAQIMEDF